MDGSTTVGPLRGPVWLSPRPKPCRRPIDAGVVMTSCGAPRQIGRRVRSRRSDVLCRLALDAYRRLYGALDADEPDLTTNISYVVARTRFERCAAAEPWTVPAEAAERIYALLDGVASTTEARRLAAWFDDFAPAVLRELDRRSAPTLPERAGPPAGHMGQGDPTTSGPIRRREGERSQELAGS
jgi:hypothetical protein